MGEMMIILLDIYRIWEIPIRGILVHQREMVNDNTHGVDYLGLIGLDDHVWDHQSIRLIEGYHIARVGCHFSMIITTYLYPNKSSLVFTLGLVWVVHRICESGA